MSGYARKTAGYAKATAKRLVSLGFLNVFRARFARISEAP